MSSHKATADATLGALEGQLRTTHAALQGAQAERRHEARKTTAAMLLTRLEVRLHGLCTLPIPRKRHADRYGK